MPIMQQQMNLEQDLRQTPLPAQSLTTDGVTSISLPLTGIHLRYYLRFVLQYDQGGTGANNEDQLGRLVRSIDIQDGSGFSYYTVHTGKLTQWMSNFYANRNSYWPVSPLSTAAVTNATQTWHGIVDFSESPTPGGPAPIQPKAGILTRARDLAQLSMLVRLGNASDLGTDFTIDSVTLYVTPVIVIHGTPTHRALINQGIARPVYRSFEHPISGAVSALGETSNLPIGFLVGRSLLIVENPDTSDNRDDSQLTDLAYADTLQGVQPWQTDFTNYESQLENGYNFTPSGAVLLN